MSGPSETAIDPAATTPAATPAAQIGGLDTVVHMNERTQQIAALMIVATLCLSALGIVGVCVVRVAIDGNAPLTESITNALLGALPWLGFCAVAVVFGKGAASALMAKVMGS